MKKPKWDEVPHEWVEFDSSYAECVLCGELPNHDLHLCPKCKYENARCACVKAPKCKQTPEERETCLKMLDEIKQAVRERKRLS